MKSHMVVEKICHCEALLEQNCQKDLVFFQRGVQSYQGPEIELHACRKSLVELVVAVRKTSILKRTATATKCLPILFCLSDVAMN